MKNIYLQIPDKLQDNSPMALATITTTSGSTPQKPGSSALFGPAGLISGTVGGGIMEAKVQQIAQDILISKKSGQYHFNLNHDIDQQEEAICGGQASVLVEALTGNHAFVFGQIKKSIDQRIPGVLVTRVNSITGDQVDIQRSWVTQFENNGIQPVPSPEMVSVLKRLFLDGKAGDYIEFISSDSQNEERIYLEPVFPYPQLVIAGAGHIGRALAHLGNLLEFEVWVVDERDDYANFENIPDADHMIIDDIGKVIESIKITTDTYIVIVTRGHKNDADALKSCIGSEAGYIGMIGSKKKVALMRQNFMEKGWATSNQWKQIYAPIGLDIHSKTVQEIAVSIAAQLIEVRNKKADAHA